MPYKSPEKRREQQRRWREQNPEYNKAWREQNPEYNKAWREQNPDKLKEYQKRYREKHANKLRHRERAAKSKTAQRKRVAALLEAVKLHYQCQNPACPVVGDLPSCCLDFHHVDPTHKLYQVSIASTVNNAIKEMKKCTVLCAVCHRRETWADLDASGFTLCDSDTIAEIRSNIRT